MVLVLFTRIVLYLYCVCTHTFYGGRPGSVLLAVFLVTPLPTVTAPPSFSTAPASKLAAQVWNSS
jgi:hypothetical protein